jgi:hypothetical protein
MKTLEYKLLKQINDCKSYNSLFKIPLKLFKNKDPKTTVTKTVKILILTSACNDGIGDIIFSHKLKKYLEQWYGDLVSVKIATSSVRQFIAINENIDDLIHLQVKGKDTNCRSFTVMKPFNASKYINENILVSENIEPFDLYLVAPLVQGSEPDYKEVHRLVKNSNRFNTFFLTEYNVALHKDILFNVGVGKGRLGLFLVDNDKKRRKRLTVLQHPYSIIYINSKDDHASHCYEGFLELLTSKYKLSRLDIVCPLWMKEELETNIDRIKNKVNEHYSKISYIYKQDGDTNKETLIDDYRGNKEIVFRFDVLPVPFTMMLSVYQHSLPHVLLTGDQSITDFLSLRHKTSMPFYQGLPWKQNFYTNLAKALPNKFLKSYKTSCGNLDAIKYDPSFQKFIKNNDFRVKGRRLMDAVICSVGYGSRLYDEIKFNIVHSRKIKTLKNKIKMIQKNSM